MPQDVKATSPRYLGNITRSYEAPLLFRWREKDELFALAGGIPVFKMHGSLNWSFEDGHLVMYADARPAFRLENNCAIVPPISEKQAPVWLQPVWTTAEACLHRAHTWVVCGYSLPDYDLSILGRCWVGLEREIARRRTFWTRLVTDSKRFGKR
jgi:hypothetical protein